MQVVWCYMHQAVTVNFMERLLHYKIYRNSAFVEVCGAVKDGVHARRQRGEEEMGVPAHTRLPPLSPCRPRAQLQALRWVRPAPHCLVRGQGGQLWGFAHSEPGVGVGDVRVVESLVRGGKKVFCCSAWWALALLINLGLAQRPLSLSSFFIV